MIEWFRDTWTGSTAGGRAAVAVAAFTGAALAGAFLFGVWHVAIGGFLKGNWRAGGFGVVLALVSGTLLWIDWWVLRRVAGGLGAR